MPQVRCQKCATVLAIKQVPASGKIKCPQCDAVISVTNPQPGSTPTILNRTQGEIDFRGIPSQAVTAPSGNFPIHTRQRVYDGPISLDPIPEPKVEEPAKGHGHTHGNHAQPQKGSSKTSGKSTRTRIIIGVITFLALCAIAGGVLYWKFGSAKEGNAANPGIAATPEST